MKYFRMKFTDAVYAVQEVWKNQDKRDKVGSETQISSNGTVTTLGIENSGATTLLGILAENGIPYKKGLPSITGSG